MSLTLSDETHGDVLVVRLKGRLDTVTSKTFEDHLDRSVAAGARRIIVDLSGVDYVSSYGLRVFLINAKKLRADRNAFRLCGLTPEVLKIFQISGFDKILTIRPSLADELARTEGGA